MLKGILGFFAFLFFLAVLILMLTGSYILKKVRRAGSASSMALVNLLIPPSQISIRRPPRLLLARLS